MSFRSWITTVSLALPVVLVSIGCGGGSNSKSTLPSTPPTPKISAVSVTPAEASMTVGDKQQLSVNATFTDGSQKDVTASSTWADSNQTVASVDGTGLVNALLAGTTTITTTNGAFNSSTIITVANPPPYMTRISVTSSSASLIVGDKQQLNVSATYSDGSQQDVTASSTWTPSDPTVATIDNMGLVSSRKTGSVMITATYGMFTSSTTITIIGPSIATWHGDNQRSGLKFARDDTHSGQCKSAGLRQAFLLHGGRIHVCPAAICFQSDDSWHSA